VLNLIAIPAMTAVQIAGILCVMLAPVISLAAAPAAAAADVSARALVDSSALVTWLPWLSWRTPPPPLVVVGLFYGATFWLMVESRARLRRLAALLVLAGVIIIATGPFAAYGAPRRGVLRVTALDVGQGDALIVQFPTGRSLLVDAGPARGSFDAGDRTVVPAFWALGGRRLDWLLVTHPDLDHIGGAVTAMRILAPSEIWEGVPVPSDVERTRLRERAAGERAAWRWLQRGDALDTGGVTIDVLHPPTPDWERQRARNDDSVVLRLRFHDVEFLLTGDVGRAVEDELAASVDEDARRIRVLKVAHHGSRTSSSTAFLRAYAPTAAVVSAGRDNLFGHPAPDVLGRLRESRARVFRTDRDGAVVLETDGRILSVRTMDGGVWNVAPWP
jgi:competence protein ComEC